MFLLFSRNTNGSAHLHTEIKHNDYPKREREGERMVWEYSAFVLATLRSLPNYSRVTHYSLKLGLELAGNVLSLRKMGLLI